MFLSGDYRVSVGGRVGDQLSPIEHKGGIDKIDCLLNANE